jgi:hypothetical protein
MYPENYHDKGLTFKDIAAVRVKREKLLPKGRLDWAHTRIACGEATLVIGVWGQGGNGVFENNMVSHDRIRSFFVHERLPADWKRPEFSLGFLKTVELGGKLRAEMDAILEAEANAARLQEAEEGKAENEPGSAVKDESWSPALTHPKTVMKTVN